MSSFAAFISRSVGLKAFAASFAFAAFAASFAFATFAASSIALALRARRRLMPSGSAFASSSTFFI